MFGLPVVLYLFLGGAGAGTFVMAAVYGLLGRNAEEACFRMFGNGEHDARVLGMVTQIKRHVTVASFLLVLSGVVCLFSDLGRPQAFYLLFIYPQPTYITTGTYALAVFMLCAGCLAADALLTLPVAFRKAMSAVCTIGLVAGLYIMVYTGLFLFSMKSIALWDTPLLPMMFFISSLSAGIAVLHLCCLSQKCCKQFRVFNGLRMGAIVATICEAATLVVYLVCTAQSKDGAISVARIISGEFASIFWTGFILCGIIIPLAVEMLGHMLGSKKGLSAFAAVLVLVGGFCMRLVVVGAGMHVVG